jgi:hypothetical protein
MTRIGHVQFWSRAAAPSPRQFQDRGCLPVRASVTSWPLNRKDPSNSQELLMNPTLPPFADADRHSDAAPARVRNYAESPDPWGVTPRSDPSRIESPQTPFGAIRGKRTGARNREEPAGCLCQPKAES